MMTLTNLLGMSQEQARSKEHEAWYWALLIIMAHLKEALL